MERFGRVQEEGRRAGARERGGDLPADEARLAHARHDHATAARCQQRHRLLETPVEAGDESLDGGGLGAEHSCREFERGRTRRAGGLGHHGHDDAWTAAWTRSSRCSSAGSRSRRKRVLGVRLRAWRVLVDFHEHAVDARGHAGAGHRLDVGGLPGRPAVAGPRQLQAMGDVVDHRRLERAQLGQRTHVHHEVVVAERRAALGEQHVRIAGGADLVERVLHLRGREELALLDVHDGAGARGGHQQVGLAAQERRNLQHVDDRGGGRGLRGLVDVGQDRHAQFGLHASEDAEAGVEPGTAERGQRRAVGLVERRLVDVGDARLASDGRDGVTQLERMRLALDDARAGNQHQLRRHRRSPARHVPVAPRHYTTRHW